jgi:glycosyltransferase involved in cell wall biosynthesis
LEALARQTYRGDWEVIIVDNGSTDGTGDVAADWRDRLPRLRVVRADERRGASYARNVGSMAARGDFLVFCDADDVVSSGWLEGMAVAAERADVIGGALEMLELNSQAAWAGRHVAPRLMPAARPDGAFAVSSNCGLWQNVFHWVGGWDESYVGAASEDKELSRRAESCGFRLGSTEGAVVHYRLRTDTRSLLRQEWHYAKSYARFYRDYRLTGVSRDSVWRAMKSWGWIMLHAPDVFRGFSRRRRWLRLAVGRLGRLWGSFQYRVIYP